MIEIAYGRTRLSVDLPAAISWQPLQTPAVEPEESESALLEKAIESLMQQLAARPLHRGDRLLLVVPDHTRKCRLSEWLPLLLDELSHRFQPVVEILIANGSHRLQPESVVADLVGDAVYRRVRVTQHDAFCQSEMRFVGATDAGTPIWLNRRVLEADCVVTIGGVLFHYFAGYGGGPKMLLPGVAGFETIRLNHRRTIDFSRKEMAQNCREGEIAANPVYRDLVQVLDFVPHVLSLQLVLDADGRIHFAQAGPVVASQEQAIRKVQQLYRIPLQEQADVVLASAGGFPGDVNLIQSHKAIHHAYRAVRPGGILVVYAECAEGIGSSTFMPYFSHDSSAAIVEALLSDYQLNGHTALSLKRKTETVRLFLVSSLPAEQVRRIGMIPLKPTDSLWQEVVFQAPAKGLIFPQAAYYLPICENCALVS